MTHIETEPERMHSKNNSSKRQHNHNNVSNELLYTRSIHSNESKNFLQHEPITTEKLKGLERTVEKGTNII